MRPADRAARCLFEHGGKLDSHAQLVEPNHHALGAHTTHLAQFDEPGFQLARVGLLKGVPATTHHDFWDGFNKEFPDIELRRGLRFVDSGRIATAGGLTSGIDLALHIVSRYFGTEAAETTARYMEYSSEAWKAAG